MKLPEILCCPQCRGHLQAHTAEGAGDPGEESLSCHQCTECGTEYRAVDGVLDFLPQDTAEKGRGQKFMESERMVGIYESKWWRRSRLFALLVKISLDDEMALIKRIAEIGPADTVLDLACGPGLYARAFAEDGPRRRVVGLDCSWPMEPTSTPRTMTARPRCIWQPSSATVM